MNWSSIFNHQNLLSSGICACPGTISGRLCIWNNNEESHFKEGDILLFIDLMDELPYYVIQKSGAIISCNHTSYSHLTSLAMAFNKPCIVGAIFHCVPKNYSLISINSWEITIEYLEPNYFNNIPISEKGGKNLTEVADRICERLYSKSSQLIAHVISLDGVENYIDYINGLFFDSMLLKKGINDISKTQDMICKINSNYPKVKIYYRFSHNAILLKNKSQLDCEIEFVRSLYKNGVSVCVFVENVATYNDIVKFRQFIFHKFKTNTPISIGTMIENKQIVENLNSIVADDLINFAAIGINDLMSSYFCLDRDDSQNQERFCISEQKISNALINIRVTLMKKGIPCYIGFPKYFRFLNDYDLLTKLGYKDFFCTLSHFVIGKKYGLSEKG